ncbi:MAG: response regulator [Fibrobacterota bacterium]
MARILIVDDDTDFARAVQALLASKGHTVSHAPDGATGCRLAKAEKPDLCILDIMMTYDSEGLDVARRLSEDPETRRIPVLCITGIRKARDLPFSLAPDADWLPVKAVLEKPVKPDRLLKAVADALNP